MADTRGWTITINGREVAVYFYTEEDAEKHAAEIRWRQPEAKVKIGRTGRPGVHQGRLL